MLPNPQEAMDLAKFTEENLNGKFHFLYSARYSVYIMADNKEALKESRTLA